MFCQGSPRTTIPWCSLLLTSWRSLISVLGLFGAFSSWLRSFWFLQKNPIHLFFFLVILVISIKNCFFLRLGKTIIFFAHEQCAIKTYRQWICFIQMKPGKLPVVQLMGWWWGSCQEWICRFPMRQSFCARSPQLPGFVVVVWWVTCFFWHVKCLILEMNSEHHFFPRLFCLGIRFISKNSSYGPFIQLKDWEGLGYPFPAWC